MHRSQTPSLRSNRSNSCEKAHLSLETLESRLVPYATTGNAWPQPNLVTISFEPDGTNLGGVSSNLFAAFNDKILPWTAADERGISDGQEHLEVITSPSDGTPWYLAPGAAAFLGLRGFDPGSFEKRRQLSGKTNWSERRRKTRYPCWLNSYCWPLGKPPIERCASMAQDVSASGVNLVLRRPFDEGTVLVMELQGAGNETQRYAIARVVHVVETTAGV
jgi:hypothetical protein